MHPATLEKLTAISLLLTGIVLLLFSLSLMGINVPFFGFLMIIAALVSVATGILLFLDARKLQ